MNSTATESDIESPLLTKTDGSFVTAKFASKNASHNLSNLRDTLEDRIILKSKRMKLFIRLEALIDLGLKVSSDQLNLESYEEVEKLNPTLRFGLKIFLASLSELFKIYLYSNKNVQALIYLAEKADIIQHVHGLMGNIESSIQFENAKVDQSFNVERNLHRTIILDTERSWIVLNKENGILMNSFKKDELEADLLVLIPFLVFLSQQKKVKPIGSLFKKYVEMTRSFSTAFKVMVEEAPPSIPIIEETIESPRTSRDRGSQEQEEIDETIPDDIDRSIYKECHRLKTFTHLGSLKEKIRQSNYEPIKTL